MDGTVFACTQSHAHTRVADGKNSELMGRFLHAGRWMVNILLADGLFLWFFHLKFQFGT